MPHLSSPSGQPLPSLPSEEIIRQVGQRVQTLDLGRIERRLARTSPDLPEAVIKQAVQDYRRFLIILCLFPEEDVMPYSRIMDEVWHNHILHTVQYEEDCRVIAGEFLHHEPADNPTPPEGLKERSLALFHAIFGEQPAIIEDF